MAKEIERKFLLAGDGWRNDSATKYVQGYLNRDKARAVRVRIIEDCGYLTIKGKSTGASRLEFEYSIPLEDAQQLLYELCHRPIIEKYRYKVEYEGLVWEVDEFLGANEGLILAEVELEDEAQEVPLPAWIGQEVTEDPRYFNAYLSQYPFTTW